MAISPKTLAETIIANSKKNLAKSGGVKGVTENQRTVFKRVMDKVRQGTKVSVSKEMGGVYSKSMQKKPDKLTKSKGWQQLLNENLPDNLLSLRHKELLNSTRLDHMVFPPFRTRELTVQIDDEEERNVGENFGEQLTDQEIRDLLVRIVR